MTYEALKNFFLWTTVIHFSILLFWIFFIKFATSWFRKQQSWWFPIPQEHFMTTHYLMYGGYKLMALIFSAVPYLALLIMGN